MDDATPHEYVSTACQHGRPEDCRRRCKYCGTPCQHPAHDGQPAADMAEVEQAILGAAWLRLYRRDPCAAAEALARMEPPPAGD